MNKITNLSKFRVLDKKELKNTNGGINSDSYTSYSTKKRHVSDLGWGSTLNPAAYGNKRV